VWRKLRRLGAAQLVDGLIALPRDSRTQEQLEWLADEIVESGGQAGIWFGRPGSRSSERELAARMAERAAAEYRSVIEAALDARTKGAASQRRTLARLRRALRAIRTRDYFPPPERKDAIAAVEDLAAVVEVPR
jgi:hypothetical protein